MSKRIATEDDWEDDSGEEWGDDDTEYVPCEGDDDPTKPCPHCGKNIFDEAERCPECGEYISIEDMPAASKPLWIVLTAIVCLIFVLLWSCG